MHDLTVTIEGLDTTLGEEGITFQYRRRFPLNYATDQRFQTYMTYEFFDMLREIGDTIKDHQ